MQKTFDLGKIDYNDTGRKINRVEIDVKLSDGRLSISGNVWNMHETDSISCGQNLDGLKPYFKYNKLFNKLWLLWKEYHLNDLQAGTTLQMAHINRVKNKFDHSDHSIDWYSWACDELGKVGLLTTTYKGKPYKFGSQWIKKEIPQDVIEFITTEIITE
tara:strand:+ start:42 stop:518 length:477 start_codon:yes stop_codon:yes gene_type:complete